MTDYTRKCEDCGAFFTPNSDQRMANSWACKPCAALRPRYQRHKRLSSKWRRLKERVVAAEPQRVEVPEEFTKPQPYMSRPFTNVFQAKRRSAEVRPTKRRKR